MELNKECVIQKITIARLKFINWSSHFKFFLIVFMTSLVISCSNNEILNKADRQNNLASVSAVTSTPLTSKPSLNGRMTDPYNSIDAKGMVVSSATVTYTPEELYISESSQLYAIDNTTGAGYLRNADEPYVNAMASTNGFIYAAIGFPSETRILYKINVSATGYTDLTPGINWANTNIMAAVGGFLYLVDGSTLWKINANTGTRSTLGARSWDGAEAMTALGSYVYIIDDGLLWRVSTSTGVASTFGSGSWVGIPAMAASGNYVYAVDDGDLWRVNVNTASIETFSPGTTWNSTVAMTALNGYVYAVDSNQLWKVNGTNGAISLLTPSGYTWAGVFIRMAALQ